MTIVNWNDPVTLAEQYFDYINLEHTLGGVYFWELFCGVWFDLRLLGRRRLHGPSVFAKWVYLACRYTPLAAFIIVFNASQGSDQINCKVWLIFAYTSALMPVSLASTLAAIRTVAIWHQSRWVIGLSLIAVVIQIAFFIHGGDCRGKYSHYHVYILGCLPRDQTDAAWVPAQSSCVILKTQTSRAFTTATLVTDVFLLLSMIIGLLRWRDVLHHSSLWQILWNQGSGLGSRELPRSQCSSTRAIGDVAESAGAQVHFSLLAAPINVTVLPSKFAFRAIVTRLLRASRSTVSQSCLLSLYMVYFFEPWLCPALLIRVHTCRHARV
ncbi:hypothetical protein PENSPDRAFT_755085 [Peniophora sp. CONT]|nr:hypothetical protein PENSPDRAFT_755085 [Peniophora sp. CONT]